MKMQPDECFGPGASVLCMALPRNTILVHKKLSAPGPGRAQTVTGRPDRPRTPARRCPYRRALLVVYAHTKDRDGGGLRASGWGRAKSRSPAQGGCGGSDPMREAGAPNTRKLKPTL